MLEAVDATNDGPVQDSSPYLIGLFVVFILIGSIFCVNLFVAIVNLKFVTAQKE